MTLSPPCYLHGRGKREERDPHGVIEGRTSHFFAEDGIFQCQ